MKINMKQLSIYLSGLALCLGLASCDTDVQGTVGPEGDGIVRVEASAVADLAGMTMTKVDFNEGSDLAVTWKKSGEKFTVIQGADPVTAVTFSQTEGNKFSGRLIEGVAGCHAVYPYLGTTRMKAGAVALDLSRQIGTMDETKTFMWARDTYDGSEMNFSFRHLTAIVKVEMTFPASAAGETVADVTLAAEKLSAKGTVDLTAENPAVVSSSYGNITLSKDFYMQGNVLNVYFNVFPGKIEDLSLVASTGGGNMFNAVLDDVDVAAGQMVTVKASMRSGAVAPKNVWMVETIVGDGTQGDALGNGLACQVGNATGIAFVPGSNEKKIWFTQRKGGLVRELTLDDQYTVTEVASGIYGTGSNTDAVWQGAFNSKGEYYLAHKGKSCVLRYDAAEKKFVLLADGINNPMNIAFDKDDNLYVPSRDAKKIIKITPAGEKSDYASTGAYKPNYITFDSKGNLICGTNGGWVIFQISPDKTVKPIIGSGTRPKDSGMSTINNGKPGDPLSACVGNSEGITVGSDGCIYFTDQTDEHCVRKLTPGPDGKYETGTITTIAGQLTGGTADGIGTEAQFKSPEEIIITKDCKTIYVACSSGNVIKKLTFMD